MPLPQDRYLVEYESGNSSRFFLKEKNKQKTLLIKPCAF